MRNIEIRYFSEALSLLNNRIDSLIVDDFHTRMEKISYE